MSTELKARDQSRANRIVTTSVWGRIRYLIVATSASWQARRMLARVIRPYKARGSPHIPPHILRDIGLPEDHYSERPSHWDHP